MVNTRRSELMSEARSHRHFSNAEKDSSVEDSSADRNSTDGEEPTASVEEESESWSPKWTNSSNVLNNRVRELRNRFVSTPQRNYSRNVDKNNIKSLRNNKHSMMDRRGRRNVFSNRNEMEDESEDMMDDLDPDTSEFNIFSSHNRRSKNQMLSKENLEQSDGENRRSTRHSEKIESIRSRTGLRPLKRESYADPHSPFSQELGNSSDEKPDIEIRRSTRQKKFKYNTFNTSWITEHQMIRGYPKFKRSFVSDHEEDSKESRVPDEENIEIRKDTENDLDLRKTRTSNKKYYKYLRRNNSSQGVHNRNQINGNSDISQPINEDNNENKDTVSNKTERIIMNGDILQESTVDNANQEQNDIENNTKQNKINEQVRNQSPIIGRLRQRAVISYNNSSMQQNESDSTTEERHNSRKYKLRQRKPKPIQRYEPEDSRERRGRRLPRRILRRRVTRNKIIDSTDSTSTSDEDDNDILRNKKHSSGNAAMQLKPSRRLNTPPRDKSKIKIKDMTLDPMTIDSSITFKSIGGLDEQVQGLREMIVLPMLYPEIFNMYHTTPPKGVLFHGPPGTGKTLMARALANECSVGSKKVSFFMRKGADLLSKWIGQTEKQMTLLFEQASQMAPSIIFFDELDGLAPARTARQEQVHVSVVASLLALMDGLDKTRGEVIVIGATNRLDALDPALRRPGRFDREIYFPLPSFNQRKDILNIMLSKWPIPPSDEVINSLAEKSIGYCGADLRALCTEAVLKSVRRTYPQIYESSYRLLIDANKIKVNNCDFDEAMLKIVPAGSRGTPLHMGSKPPSYLEPLLSKSINTAIELIHKSFPVSNKHVSPLNCSNAINHCARLLLAGSGSHVTANALLKEFEHLPILTLDIISLHNDLSGNPEQACIQILNEARRNSPSVLYLPKINMWWDNTNETVKVLLNMMYSTFLTNFSTHNTSILLLATIDIHVNDFPNQICELFSKYRHEVLEIEIPTQSDREAFFKPLIIDEASALPLLKDTKEIITYEELPRAPTPPPPALSPHAKKLLFEKEEETLIELRIFLRDVCKKTC